MAIKVARIITGSGVRHSLSIYGSDGTALDLTGATPRTVTYYSPAGVEVIAAKTITLSGTPSVAPQGYVDIAASEYSAVTAYTSLYGQVSITLSTGKVHTEDFVQPIGPHEPVSGKLVQLSDLKEALGVTSVTDDNFLYLCIDRAQAAIQSRCNRIFASATYTEDFDGTGTAKYATIHAPITSITSLNSLARGSDGTETATALSASEYRYDGPSGVVSLLGDDGWYGFQPEDGPRTFVVESPRFTPGFRNYRIVYTAGYTAGTVPHDLQQACIDYAKHLYLNRTANPGMLSESIGGGLSYTRREADDLWATIGPSIAQYQRFSL